MEGLVINYVSILLIFKHLLFALWGQDHTHNRSHTQQYHHAIETKRILEI